MKILLDMNLSPEWVSHLLENGWEARHWRDIGAPNAPDAEILGWAKKEGRVVRTQDLEFADMLFATQADLPSLVSLRLRDELNEATNRLVSAGLRQFQMELESGALLVMKSDRVRLRRLPLDAS